MPPDRFKSVCRQIVNGLGFVDAHEVSRSGIPAIFEETIERRSTDGMFRTKESWLLAFIRSNAQATVNKGLEGAAQWAELNGMHNVLVVVFGSVDPKNAEKYHANDKIGRPRTVLLTESFALTLLQDYAADEVGPVQPH